MYCNLIKLKSVFFFERANLCNCYEWDSKIFSFAFDSPILEERYKLFNTYHATTLRSRTKRKKESERTLSESEVIPRGWAMRRGRPTVSTISAVNNETISFKKMGIKNKCDEVYKI